MKKVSAVPSDFFAEIAHSWVKGRTTCVGASEKRK